MKIKFLITTLIALNLSTSSAWSLEVVTKTQINSGEAFRGEFSLNYDYPQIKYKDKKVEEKINSYIRKAVPETDSLWSSIINTIYKSPKLLSVFVGEFYNVELDGAAHGQPYHHGWNFDLKTGEKLNINDLFKKDSNYKEIINAKVKQKIEAIDFYYSNKFETIDEDEDFYITDEFLVMIFHPYVYTCFAESPLKVYIPWENFDEILKYKIEKSKYHKENPTKKFYTKNTVSISDTKNIETFGNGKYFLTIQDKLQRGWYNTRKIEGNYFATLKLTLTDEGVLSNYRFIKSSGNKELDKTILKAVEHANWDLINEPMAIDSFDIILDFKHKTIYENR